MQHRTLDWFSRLILRDRSHAAETRPRTILVVDDEGAILNFVARVLRESGFHVATARNGAEALVLAATVDRLDALVTDLMMPQMNGDELARRLRVAEPDLPVLYLTGFSDRLFADRSQLWDNEAFLDKPCSVKGLLEALRLVIHEPLTERVETRAVGHRPRRCTLRMSKASV